MVKDFGLMEKQHSMQTTNDELSLQIVNDVAFSQRKYTKRSYYTSELKDLRIELHCDAC